MKTYMIFTNEDPTECVYSNSEKRAKEYAEQILEESGPNTTVHIMKEILAADVSINWRKNIRRRTSAKKTNGNSKKTTPSVRGPYNTWSKQDMRKLEALYAEGITLHAIAKLMDRTEYSISSKVYKMGLQEKYGRYTMSEGTRVHQNRMN